MNDSVDLETLNMLKEVMEDDFALLLQTFIDDAQTRIPQLRDQLAVGSHDELRRNAHSLKGSSGNVGATGMSEVCMRLENMARDGQLDTASALIDEVESSFEQVKVALQALL